jgi:hypothetical protein
MSEQELKECVLAWANNDVVKTENWIKMLSENDVDTLSILLSLSPEAFAILLKNI